jgi:hypothetical protein
MQNEEILVTHGIAWVQSQEILYIVCDGISGIRQVFLQVLLIFIDHLCGRVCENIVKTPLVCSWVIISDLSTGLTETEEQ